MNRKRLFSCFQWHNIRGRIQQYPQLRFFITDCKREPAMCGVIFGQMKNSLLISCLIDGDQLYLIRVIFRFIDGPGNASADPAIPVNGNINHIDNLFNCLFIHLLFFIGDHNLLLFNTFYSYHNQDYNLYGNTNKFE